MLHAKLGTIKDRNSKDIAKAKEIKQGYTEEMYKKFLITWIAMTVWLDT